jgi:hypothetical protein
VIARVARFEGVNVAEAERTMEEAEAVVRPMIEALAGYAGHLELLSDTGNVLSITLFDDEESAKDAESTFDEEMPSRLGDLFKGWEGRRISVDFYKALFDIRN